MIAARGLDLLLLSRLSTLNNQPFESGYFLNLVFPRTHHFVTTQMGYQEEVFLAVLCKKIPQPFEMNTGQIRADIIHGKN